MPHLLLKLSLLITFILTIMSLAAHSFGFAQPSNSAMRGFTDGCEAHQQPCWRGIVPGITTIDQAKSDLLNSGYSINSTSTLQLSASQSTDNDCQKTIILFDSRVKQINTLLCETVVLGDFVRQFDQPEYIMLDPLSIWYRGEIQIIFGKQFSRWETLSYYTPLQEVILFPSKSSVPQLRQPWLDVLLQRKYCNLEGLRYHCSN